MRPPEPDQKTSLDQYRIVTGYLQYENSAFWHRTSVFIAAQAAYLGLIARTFPKFDEGTTSDIPIPAFASIIGLLVSLLAYSVLKRSEIWIERWTTLLQSMEARSFGNIDVFRDLPRTGIKNRIYELQNVFAIAWVGLLIYLAAFAGFTWNKCTVNQSVDTTPISAPR